MTRFTYSAAHGRALVAPLMPGDDVDPDVVYAAAVWSGLAEGGDRVAGALVQARGAVDALGLVLAEENGQDAAGVSPKEWSDAVARWRPRLVQDELDLPLHRAAASGVRLILPGETCWPRGLDDLGPHAPLCLWVRGDPATLTRLHASIALVGARAATGYGEHVARELSSDLAQRGLGVVSGAAYGIDAAAHRAALDAAGLTVALMAGGVDRPYPAGHLELIDAIARTGAVVSEVPCGGSPTKWRFLARNRLIAAMSDATVVVEAGWRSGALNTANHASDLGRPVGVVPGPVTSPASAGCHRLLRDTAREVRCVTSADEVIELISGGGMFTMSAMRSTAGPETPEADVRPRTDDRTRVGDALSLRSARTVDEVARRSGMAVADVQLHLGLMRLDGEVEQDGHGWRRLATAR
ncbi:DNA-processing protein DprA [Microbacterium candidum]|uniref:DNA-processing protein DprA n=1 Tax=Microbacterium candidum TaxID=3041922 RepID=A0ABT7MZT7_9MICO|nr:DNA-processing protein DprA [Microbacterium sp. ASV49]MDL9979960.1 DNA-processing protein DprA [Microbacterium sp. ASV49]